MENFKVKKQIISEDDCDNELSVIALPINLSSDQHRQLKEKSPVLLTKKQVMQIETFRTNKVDYKTAQRCLGSYHVDFFCSIVTNSTSDVELYSDVIKACEKHGHVYTVIENSDYSHQIILAAKVIKPLDLQKNYTSKMLGKNIDVIFTLNIDNFPLCNPPQAHHHTPVMKAAVQALFKMVNSELTGFSTIDSYTTSVIVTVNPLELDRMIPSIAKLVTQFNMKCGFPLEQIQLSVIYS